MLDTQTITLSDSSIPNSNDIPEFWEKYKNKLFNEIIQQMIEESEFNNMRTFVYFVLDDNNTTLSDDLKKQYRQELEKYNKKTTEGSEYYLFCNDKDEENHIVVTKNPQQTIPISKFLSEYKNSKIPLGEGSYLTGEIKDNKRHYNVFGSKVCDMTIKWRSASTDCEIVIEIGENGISNVKSAKFGNEISDIDIIEQIQGGAKYLDENKEVYINNMSLSEALKAYLEKELDKKNQRTSRNSQQLLSQDARDDNAENKPAQQTELLSKSNQELTGHQNSYPEVFYKGEATKDGNCFFDSFRQSLEQQKEIEVTVEQLREDCKTFASNDPPQWFTHAITNSYDNNGNKRSETITLYTKEILNNNRWGDSDVEGRILCKSYGVKLHVMETNPYYSDDKQQDEFLHQLISNEGSKSVSEIDYNDGNVLHIINSGKEHFKPLLNTDKKNLVENNKVSEDVDDIIPFIESTIDSTQYEELNNKLDIAKRNNIELKEKLKEKDTEITTLKKDLSNLSAKRDPLEEELLQAKETIKTLKNENKKQANIINTKDGIISNKESENKNKDEQINKLKKELQENQKKSSDQDTVINEMIQDSESQIELLKQEKEKNTELQNELREVKNDVQFTNNINKDLQNQFNGLEKKLSQKENDLAKLQEKYKSDLAEAKETIASLLKEITDLKNKVANLENENNLLKITNSDLKDGNHSLREEIEKLSAELNKLQDDQEKTLKAKDDEITQLQSSHQSNEKIINELNGKFTQLQSSHQNEKKNLEEQLSQKEGEIQKYKNMTNTQTNINDFDSSSPIAGKKRKLSGINSPRTPDSAYDSNSSSPIGGDKIVQSEQLKARLNGLQSNQEQAQINREQNQHKRGESEHEERNFNTWSTALEKRKARLNGLQSNQEQTQNNSQPKDLSSQSNVKNLICKFDQTQQERTSFMQSSTLEKQDTKKPTYNHDRNRISQGNEGIELSKQIQRSWAERTNAEKQKGEQKVR